MDIQGVPPGSVVITPEGMYQELKAVHGALDNLISKFDDVPDKLRDHESRLRSVEQWRWKTQGLAIAGSLLFGGVSGTLSAYLVK
jgi:hypothetical protein